MGNPRGFLTVERKKTEYRPVCERVKDYRDVVKPRSDSNSQEQASGCMDCCTPFCHWGCPLGNYIPEWNDLLFNGEWEKAAQLLSKTNNFPEITGRLCPALCEAACVLGVNDKSVTVRENELAIIEHAFRMGYIRPKVIEKRTGKKVAVIGSGPAGLACADQLNKAGHTVTIFERDEKAGGILRYGIPDFKLEKWVLDRRLTILSHEGITLRTSTTVGKDYPTEDLLKEFDAVCLAGGSRMPRDMKIEGRELRGVHFAMDYLSQSNRRIAGQQINEKEHIDAAGKSVLVIGGGDTGSDCVGTANRQGASCVVQVEVMARPPECRTNECPWPKYPLTLKTSSSHEEGAERKWSILTKKFEGENGQVKRAHCVQVEFTKDEKGCPAMKEIPNSEFVIDCDLVILAIGFVHPEHEGLLKNLGVAFDQRGNVNTGTDFMTSVKGVFTCGDMHRGQSLIVWAISEGRKAAQYIDAYLK